MNTYETLVAERHFRSQMYSAREKRNYYGLKTLETFAQYYARRFLPPLITSSMIVLLRNAFSSVTGVPRYYRMPRTTKDDGRYSLTSQRHLSRERWTLEK